MKKFLLNVLITFFYSASLFSATIQQFSGFVTQVENMATGHYFYSNIPWYAAVATYVNGGTIFTFPSNFSATSAPIVQVTALQLNNGNQKLDVRVTSLTTTSITVYVYNSLGLELSNGAVNIHLLAISYA